MIFIARLVTGIIYFFVFLAGIVIGSFLNVFIFRYNTGFSSLKGRSICFACGRVLRWIELIPIVSFIFQKGRCRTCESKISLQYILIEILTGIVFVLVFSKIFSLSFQEDLLFVAILKLVFYWIIFSILIVIAVYDSRHKIIPDRLVYIFIVLSFLGGIAYFLNLNNWGFSWISDSGFWFWFIDGPLAALPFFALWFFSKGRWMGFGDVKLAFGLGFLLGPINALYAILWSFWIGGAFSVLLLAFQSVFRRIKSRSAPFSTFFKELFLPSKRFTIKSEIPFGPFLAIAIFLVWILPWDFLHLEVLF